MKYRYSKNEKVSVLLVSSSVNSSVFMAMGVPGKRSSKYTPNIVTKNTKC